MGWGPYVLNEAEGLKCGHKDLDKVWSRDSISIMSDLKYEMLKKCEY